VSSEPLILGPEPARGPCAAGRPGPPRVVRPRLVRRLEAAVEHPLTVLTAPAGSGKSVLVDQWRAGQRRARVGCVAFQPGDDARRAAARLTAGLASLGGDPFSVSPAGRGRAEIGLGERFVARLEGGLAGVGPAILVLDGLDAPADPALAAELATVADQVPANVRLVVTGRALGRAAGAGGDGITRLDADDLAFTPEDAWLLVRDVAGHELTDGELGELLRRTDGWAAGVTMAAIGLRAADDAGAYLAQFSGRHGGITAFLRDQVLAREVPDVRRFLVRTSVLRTLSGPGCDAVTGGSDGADQLRDLEARGVLTHRLPGAGERFTFHRLFRDFLRHELTVTEPEAEPVLLGRAGAWHDGRGKMEAAARSYLEARSWASVVGLVERCGPAMLAAGRAADVAGWLDALPRTGAAVDVDLALTIASLRTVTGAFARAVDIVHPLEGRGLSRGQAVAVDVLRATWACFGHGQADALAAVEAARARLERTPPPQRPTTLGMPSPVALAAMAEVLRARAAWFDGRVSEARHALTALARPDPRGAPERVHAVSTLALLEAWAGNLTTAQRQADRIDLAASRVGLALHPATVDARLATADVRCERGDLAGADVALAEAYAVLAASGPPTSYAPYALERARWHLASGQPHHGLAVIARCHESAPCPLPPAVASRLAALEVRLLVASGRADRAEGRLATAARASTCDELSAASVHCAVARGALETARARLARWRDDEAEPVGRLQHGLWRSIVEFEAGSRRPALEQGLELVQWAEPEGYLQRLLEAGRPAERLFRALYHTSPTPYLRRVIQAAQTSSQTTGVTVLGLSRRELEVVRYLPTPLSSSEIAARLYISLNTLKTHLQAIYGKLGVTGRRDAIRQAQRLGLA
jgi:ATP/maltotriose-dependent transcriptional regulator MalT